MYHFQLSCEICLGYTTPLYVLQSRLHSTYHLGLEGNIILSSMCIFFLPSQIKENRCILENCIKILCSLFYINYKCYTFSFKVRKCFSMYLFLLKFPSFDVMWLMSRVDAGGDPIFTPCDNLVRCHTHQ